MHGSYFETGHAVEDLIFKGLTVSSKGGFFGLCLAAFCLTFLHEALRVFRQHLYHGASVPTPSARYSLSASPTHEESPSGETSSRNERSSLVRVAGMSTARLSRPKLHLIQSLLYMVQLFLAYIIMLVVMSYNVWLFLSILLGAGLAHFIMGLTPISSNTMIATPDSAHCDNGH